MPYNNSRKEQNLFHFSLLRLFRKDARVGPGVFSFLVNSDRKGGGSEKVLGHSRQIFPGCLTETVERVSIAPN